MSKEFKRQLKIWELNKTRFYGDDPGTNNDDPGTGDQDDPGSQDPGDQEDSDQGNNQDSGSVDELPPWAQKEIKKLRGENASRRTKMTDLESRFSKLETGMKQALGLEEDEDPEEKLNTMTKQNEALEFHSAVLEIAYENDIPKDKVEYFEFLLGKSINELDEGQELSDESLNELIQKVKGQGQGPANSSVDGDNKDRNPDNGDKGGDVSLDAFVNMNVLERSNLYNKNPSLYGTLMKEARVKSLI